MDIATIMTKRIVTIDMDDTIFEVKSIFENLNIHHIMVVSDDHALKGIISDRDLLRAISPTLDTLNETDKDRAVLNIKAHQIMSRNLITLKATNKVIDAIHIFNTHTISCIPIINDNGQPVGIVSWRDLLAIYSAAPPPETDSKEDEEEEEEEEEED